MAESIAHIYKKAFEIAVRCARELNGTPELKEAQKDNRALKPFMDFCLEKATEEASEHTVTDIVPVVRCKDCKCGKPVRNTLLADKVVNCALYDPMPIMQCDDFCSYGERREGE